jgi:hypothetical protein
MISNTQKFYFIIQLMLAAYVIYLFVKKPKNYASDFMFQLQMNLATVVFVLIGFQMNTQQQIDTIKSKLNM